MAFLSEISMHLPAVRTPAQRYGLHSVAIVRFADAGDIDPACSDLDLVVNFGQYTDELGMRAVYLYLDAQEFFGRCVNVISTHGIRNPSWRAIC
jgi:predicted nucleotidyltransferase